MTLFLEQRYLSFLINGFILEDLLVQEELADLLPHVEQANDISQELDKKVVFHFM